jgi:hypothetical protein
VQLADKFRECAGRTLTAVQMDRAIDLVFTLEAQRDLSALMDAVTPQ